jgi:hypothetical protein
MIVLRRSLCPAAVICSFGALRAVAQAPPAPDPPRDDIAYLGAYTELLDAQKPDSGLRITYVTPHSTAEALELKAGDEILAINDVLVRNSKQFGDEVRRNNVGGTIRLVVRRGGGIVNFSGKIKGYKKTMEAVQADLRKAMVGKPLPPQPEFLWWRAGTARFEKRAEALAQLKGKIALLVWYDDCPVCLPKRYEFLEKLELNHSRAPQRLPIALVGLFYDEADRDKGPDPHLESARQLYEKRKPAFPAAVVHYPDKTPGPKERQDLLYIFNHGLVVLDPEGKVAFLQIYDAPDERAVQLEMERLLQRHFQKPPAGEPEPPETPPGGAAGKEKAGGEGR